MQQVLQTDSNFFFYFLLSSAHFINCSIYSTVWQILLTTAGLLWQ